MHSISVKPALSLDERAIQVQQLYCDAWRAALGHRRVAAPSSLAFRCTVHGMYSGPQPWEGITGRVKQLMKKETSVLMGKIGQNQQAVKGVETQLGNKILSIDQRVQRVEESVEKIGDNVKQILQALQVAERT